MKDDKSSWWVSIAALAAISLCCGLPLLLTAFGAGAVAIAAIAKFGFAGVLVAGVLGLAIYLWLQVKRRRSCKSSLAAPRQTPKGL